MSKPKTEGQQTSEHGFVKWVFAAAGIATAICGALAALGIVDPDSVMYTAMVAIAAVAKAVTDYGKDRAHIKVGRDVRIGDQAKADAMIHRSLARGGLGDVDPLPGSGLGSTESIRSGPAAEALTSPGTSPGGPGG